MIDCHLHLLQGSSKDLILNTVDGAILASTDYIDSKHNLDFIHSQPELQSKLRLFVGLHPCFLSAKSSEQALQELAAISSLLSDNLVLGLGEIGLDKRLAAQEQKLSELVFAKQLELSIAYNKLVCIHQLGLYEAMHAQLQYYKPRGLLHDFRLSTELYTQYSHFDFYFSLSPRFLRSKHKYKLVQALDLERVVLESDYDAHNAFDVANFAQIIDFVAQERHLSPSLVATMLEQNSLRLMAGEL